MYDRDYVKTLEREIELNSGNRFDAWSLSSDNERKVSEAQRPDQATVPPEQLIRK